MKITVIVDDCAVGKDGVFHTNLDFSNVPNTVHALQWKDTSGFIEYKDLADGTPVANVQINVLPVWVTELLAQWEPANGAAEMHKITIEMAMEANSLALERERIAAALLPPLETNTNAT